MKGLDTNVLVRYLTQDDPKQAQLATKEIEVAAAEGEKLVIQPLVLCELVWVMENAYGYNKPEILIALDQIMRTAQFEVPEKEVVWQALNEYRKDKGDFSDYYLGRINEKVGAEITLTFDKSLRGNKRFRVLLS
ncbi:MAG: type II toxin-antitoxin system VapC family toxin [Deltaproteobacteria bacterium]|nr:type II toxin-antitoxin system VapC family toxin [Deltaproteobacteria bacterium]